MEAHDETHSEPHEDLFPLEAATDFSSKRRKSVARLISWKSCQFLDAAFLDASTKMQPVDHKHAAHQLRGLLLRMDKDAGGLIEESEWTTYAKYAVEHGTAARTSNNLDLNLQSVIRHLCTKEQLRYDSVDEAIHDIFRTFDDNESSIMTVAEFETGLMDMNLLPWNFEVNGVKRRYDPKSLHLFTEKNSFRKFLVEVMLHKLFDRFILVTIVANSCILALEDYEDVGLFYGSPNLQNRIVQNSEYVFAAIFLVEMTVKVIGMGFMAHDNSYLKDSWNILDFIVVLSSAATLLPGVPTLSAVRTFRILRPLRAISGLPGMRLLVSTLLAALPLMRDALSLLSMIFAVFAIFGLLLWNGRFTHSCRSSRNPIGRIWPYADNARVCGRHHFTCLNGTFCGSNSDWPSLSAQQPMPPQSVNFGLTNFDNIGYAFLTIFQVVTLEGWTTIMYMTMDSSGWYNCFFFVLLVVVGAFFTLNLLFGIIFNKFKKTYTAMSAEKSAIEEAEAQRKKTLMSRIVQRSRSSSTVNKEQSQKPLGPLYKLKKSVVAPAPPFKQPESLSPSGLSMAQLSKQAMTINKVRKQLKGQCQLTGHVAPDSAKHRVAKLKIAGHVINVFHPQFYVEIMLFHLKRFASASFDHSHGFGISRLPDLRHSKAHLRAPDRFCRTCHTVVHSHTFNVIILACIFFNTVSLSMSKYPEDRHETCFLEKANVVMTVVFAIEMLLKLAGLGIQQYARDVFNVFDGIIVIIGVVELSMAYHATGTATAACNTAVAGAGTGGGSAISALRSFRLFRVFKLARGKAKLQQLLSVVARTCLQIGNFGFLLMLIIFIFALVGMQFFATKFRFDPKSGEAVSWEPERYPPNHPPWSIQAPYENQRSNFDTLGNSAITVFQLLTGEDWHQVMYSAIRGTGWASVIYFIAVYCVGRLVLVNLFLSMLTTNFNLEREKYEKTEDSGVKKTEDSGVKKTEDSGAKTTEDSGVKKTEDSGVKKTEDSSAIHPVMVDRRRSIFQRIVGHQHFDQVILVLIFVSSVTLAIDNPLDDPASVKVKILSTIDFALTIVFTLEMALKLLALGLKGYVSDGWNALDGSIVLLSLLSIVAAGSSFLESVKSLRALRALRPLRVINRAPGLKSAVNTLILAIPGAGNVCMVVTLFFLIFAILGTDLFKGKFHSCVISTLTEEQISFIQRGFGLSPQLDGQAFLRFENVSLDSPTRYSFSENNCSAIGGNWLPASANFDNVGNSLVTLFIVATTESWVSIMRHGVDVTAIGQQPVQDQHPEHAIFFILFMIICSFMGTKLFVGAVLDSYKDGQAKGSETLFMTTHQREWVESQQIMARAKLHPVVRLDDNSGNLRKICFRLQKHKFFESFIMFCIVANTVAMAMITHPQDATLGRVIDGSNELFALIFLAEAVIKIIALRKIYFKSAWNLFDFAVVTATILTKVIELTSDIDVGNIANLARAFRIALVLRLFESAKSMDKLANIIIVNIPTMANISGILFLVLYVFAAMGLQLFAEVKSPQHLINDRVNFQSFSQAFLVLFRCMTGEAWNEIMDELTIDSGCIDQPTFAELCAARSDQQDPTLTIGCSPGRPMVYLYFGSFIITTTYLSLNLFIAVLLDGFESQMEADDSCFSYDQFQILRNEWQKYDLDADYFLEEADFLKFLENVLEPLGAVRATYVHYKEDKAVLMRIAKSLELQDYDGRVYFREVARALAKLVFVRKTRLDASVIEGVSEINLAASEKSAKALEFMQCATAFTYEERCAAKLIQSVIRGRKARAAVMEKKKLLMTSSDTSTPNKLER